MLVAWGIAHRHQSIPSSDRHRNPFVYRDLPEPFAAAITAALIHRINTASSLYQLFEHMSDVVLLSPVSATAPVYSTLPDDGGMHGDSWVPWFYGDVRTMADRRGG